MKRIILFIFLILTITACSSNKNDGLVGSDESSFLQEPGQIHLLLYFGSEQGDYLVPELRVVDRSSNIEEVIVRELIKGPVSNGTRQLIPKDTKVLYAKLRSNTVLVNLSSDFKLTGTENNLAVSSIVNSLTELPGIKYVQLLIDGRRAGQIIKRNKDSFKRENLNPSEVMKRQMNLEKDGNWANAYILMSDDKNREGWKPFDEYVREMEEAKQEGFMDVEFVVGDYSLHPDDTNRASVKVGFIVKDENGIYVKGPEVHFNTIKIDGFWKVDWQTGQ